MSTDLVKYELTQLEQDVLSVISTSEISSPIQIANLLDVDESEVIAILNNDKFYEIVCSRSLSNLRLAHHSIAIPKLINKLTDEKEFFNAYDRLTKAISAVGQKDASEMHKVSLEVLVKEKTEEKNVTPHKEQTKEQDINLNSVSKVQHKTSGNIFALEDNQKVQVSPHKKVELEIEWEE